MFFVLFVVRDDDFLFVDVIEVVFVIVFLFVEELVIRCRRRNDIVIVFIHGLREGGHGNGGKWIRGRIAE